MWRCPTLSGEGGAFAWGMVGVAGQAGSRMGCVSVCPFCWLCVADGSASFDELRMLDLLIQSGQERRTLQSHTPIWGLYLGLVLALYEPLEIPADRPGSAL